MKPREVDQNERRLDALFAKTASIADLEVQAHWARYLCVLTSGYLEVSVRAVLREYARRRSAPEVSRYVDGQLERMQNPSWERIIQLVGSLDRAAAVDAEGLDQAIKDAVSSVVANRHGIAHGRNHGVTVANARSYFDRSRRLVDF